MEWMRRTQLAKQHEAERGLGGTDRSDGKPGCVMAFLYLLFGVWALFVVAGVWINAGWKAKYQVDVTAGRLLPTAEDRPLDLLLVIGVPCVVATIVAVVLNRGGRRPATMGEAADRGRYPRFVGVLGLVVLGLVVLAPAVLGTAVLGLPQALAVLGLLLSLLLGLSGSHRAVVWAYVFAAISAVSGAIVLVWPTDISCRRAVGVSDIFTDYGPASCPSDYLDAAHEAIRAINWASAGLVLIGVVAAIVTAWTDRIARREDA